MRTIGTIDRENGVSVSIKCMNDGCKNLYLPQMVASVIRGPRLFAGFLSQKTACEYILKPRRWVFCGTRFAKCAF